MENNLLTLDIYQAQSGKNETLPDRRLMDQIHGFALFQLNNDGDIIHWNQSALLLTGYLAEEIIGQHFSRLYDSHEKQLQKMPLFCLGVAIKQGFYETKGWMFRRDGSNFLAQVMIMHIPYQNGGYIVMVWDITKNRRATAELDEHRQQSPLDE
jgi:PAS domain S-box-containing protein